VARDLRGERFETSTTRTTGGGHLATPARRGLAMADGSGFTVTGL